MTNPETKVGNRVAIVTGAGGNLGRAVARALCDRGCRVVAIDRDPNITATFRDANGIVGIECDLASPADTERCLTAAWDKFGPISILVNAAGLIHSAPLISLSNSVDRRHSPEAWHRVIEANLTTVFLTTLYCVDRMVSTRTRGVVVSLSSIAASGNAGQGAYSAAKAGVNALTRSWAKELGPLGIRFVAIAPGFIDTTSTRAALSEPMLNEWTRRTPLRRLGTVENVTSSVLFAIENEHLTGKIIELDGGLTI